MATPARGPKISTSTRQQALLTLTLTPHPYPAPTTSTCSASVRAPPSPCLCLCIRRFTPNHLVVPWLSAALYLCPPLRQTPRTRTGRLSCFCPARDRHWPRRTRVP